MKPIVHRITNENNLYQHIEVIKRNRKRRVQFNEFFIEGVQSINFAMENQWQLKTLAYSTDKPLSGWARQVLEQSDAEMHVDMPLALMEKLSEKDEEFSEIIALAAIPEDDLSRIPVHEHMLVVIFDRPSSHGNLGTLIRSSEALKVDGVIITGHAVDLYDPKTIRSSMGTFFSIPTLRVPSHNELMPWFDQLGKMYEDFQVIGSTSKAEHLIEEVKLTGPTVLLIGNETYGLSNKYKELCHHLVKIPMYGKITSFNVACAASIMLYEIDRQRRSDSLIKL